MSVDPARLIFLSLLLVALGGFLWVEFRRDAGVASRAVAAWGLIFVAAIAAAGLWEDIRRDILPRQAVVSPTRIEVPVGPDGHFHLTAQINGTPIRLIVDTGASSIALGPRDAARIGIDPDQLAYVGEARTANGTVETAPVTLDSVAFGEIHDSRVPAMVLKSDLEQSLMGMSYHSRFARVSIEGNRLILER